MTTEFGEATSAEEAARKIDLSGKTIVLTGGSAGLGVETARVLSACGARIVSVVRNEEKGEAAAAQIRESVPNADIELAVLDLFDLDSVRRAAPTTSPNDSRASTGSSTTPASWPAPSAEPPRASTPNSARITSDTSCSRRI